MKKKASDKDKKGHTRPSSPQSLLKKIKKEYLTEERTLKEKIEDPELFFNFPDVMLIVIGKDQRVLKINKKGCEILGYPEKEIIGKKYFDNFIPLRFRDEMKEFFNDLVSGKKILRRYFENPVLTKKGERLIAWRNAVLKDRKGNIIGTISEGRDITEERKKQEELLARETKFRSLFENAPAGFVYCDIRTIVYDVNSTFLDLVGIEKKEIIGKPLKNLIVPEDRKFFNKMLTSIKETENISVSEFRMMKKDGENIDVCCTATVTGEENKMLQIILYDITRRRILENFHKISNEINSILNQSFDVSTITKKAEKILKKNLGFDDVFILLKENISESRKGNEIDKFLNNFLSDRHISGVEQLSSDSFISKITKNKRQEFFVSIKLRENGKTTGALVCFHKNKNVFSNDLINFLEAIAQAISTGIQKSSVYEKLRSNYENYNAFVNATRDMTFIKDSQFRYIQINSNYAKFFKKKPEHILGKTDFDLMDDYAARRCRESDLQALKEKRTVVNEEIVGGRIYETRKFPVKLESGETGIGAYIREITEEKEAEQKIQNLMWMYNMLYQINQAIVRAKNKQQLFDDVCEIATKSGKFVLAWIGIADYEKKTVIPVAGSKEKKGYFENIHISLDPEKLESKEPTARAIKTGKICVCNDILKDPKMLPWRGKAKTFGFCSSAAVPLKLHQNIIGAINFYSDQPYFFTEEIKKLLSEIASDIELCIEKLNAEEIRKRAEKQLRENEKHLRTIFDNSHHPIAEIDCSEIKKKLDFLRNEQKKAIEAYLSENQELLKQLKNSIKIINVSKQFFSFYDCEDPDKISNFLKDIIIEPEILALFHQNGRIDNTEKKIKTEKGIEKTVLLNILPLPDFEKNWAKVIISMIDITERIYLEQNLKSSLSRFRGFFETSSAGMGILDLEGKAIALNNQICEMLGYTKEELGKMKLIDIVPEEDKHLVKETYEKMKMGEISHYSVERRYVKKDGTIIWANVSASLFFDPVLNKECIAAVVVDITPQKKYQQQIEIIQKLLQIYAECNNFIARAKDEKQMLFEICNKISTIPSFSAFIALKDNSGLDVSAYPKGIENFISELKGIIGTGIKSPTTIGIFENRISIVNDVLHCDFSQEWKNLLLRYGFYSAIAMPLIVEGHSIGSLSIYAGEKNRFENENEIAILKAIAENTGYGVTMLRTRKERDVSGEKLRLSYMQLQDTLEGIALAIAKIIETRDPYTAGHQSRVGKLSMAIAKEMGLPENVVQGIRFSSILHDIGKINVPVEILVKPGKLAPDEFNIIKLHSSIGYEILNKIPFPWPVAKIVLQHHERLNGSGYPDGIKDQDILTESKIVAVADVVEAMAYDRPYRPALGIDFALNEIKNQSGILFDPEVVDVCIKLFKEKGFTFD